MKKVELPGACTQAACEDGECSLFVVAGELWGCGNPFFEVAADGADGSRTLQKMSIAPGRRCVGVAAAESLFRARSYP